MRRSWPVLFAFFAALLANPVYKDKLSVEEVEVVLGSAARLPCDLLPPEDDDGVALVIWYKDDDKTPIYSLDVRERDLRKGIHWADGDLEGRASLASDLYRSTLTLEDTRGADSGLYKCRVDFKRSPTRNSLVNVTVIVPPEAVQLEDAAGVPVTSRSVGPLPEGDPLELTCVATGGVPAPRLSWWYNLTLLDDSYEVAADGGEARNTLRLAKLERDHLHAVLTCQALNSPFVVPTSTSVSIELYLGPLDVRLLGDNLPMSAGSEYEVACQTSGSRPPAAITWSKSGSPLLHLPARETSSIEGNVTTSAVRLRPDRSDHGAKLSCRAANPRVPDKAIETSWTLDVHFFPEVSVALAGASGASWSVREGDAALLECRVACNPPAIQLQWLHNGVAIEGGLSLNQQLSNRSLSLAFVTRGHGGLYSCRAANAEGAADSPAYLLDVQYAPQCRMGEERLYGASHGEQVQVPCEVSANPTPLRYWWRVNATAHARTWCTNSSAAAVSLGDATELTLICWAENSVGNQSEPCSVRIVLASVPEPPSNCTAVDRGESWLAVVCVAGADGGLPQTFGAEAVAAGRAVANASRAGAADFRLTGLRPGFAYTVAVRSANARGASEPAVLRASTAGTERRTTAGKLIESFAGGSETTLLLLGIASFAACLLAVVALLAAAAVFFRRHRPTTGGSPKLKKIDQMIVAESNNVSDDDCNPDVIPCNSEVTVLQVTGEGEGVALESCAIWETQLLPVNLINTQTVPCLPVWGGVGGWRGSCPNIAQQRHAETQTPQNVLESVV